MCLALFQRSLQFASMRALCNRAIGRLLHPRSTAQVQVLSDLHLEVGQQYLTFTFPPTAPFLLLAGDIGRLVDYEGYLKFLEAHVGRYKKVLLVLGNHEFYGLDYDTGLETARRLVSEPTLVDKVFLLHRARWDDPDSDLTVLGCTLWSAIPPDAYDIVAHKVKDYKNIDGWSVDKHNELHASEAAWLREQVAQVSLPRGENTRRLLVATHHAPSVEGTSKPEHTGNPWTCAFATDLAGREGWENVRVWVFGHTHYSTDWMCNGTRLVANQRGYVLPRSTAEGPKSAGGAADKAHSFDATFAIAI